jgi:hexosaminidase
MRRTKRNKAMLACGAAVAAVLLVLTTAFRSRGSLSLIPRPSEVRLTRGVHRLGASMCVLSEQPSFAADFLVERMRLVTGWKVPLVGTRGATGPAAIVLHKNVNNMASEAYTLTITPERIRIEAGDEAGLFYGVQTMLQLLPAQIFSNSVAHGVEWTVPCVRIVDRPRFAWRGLLLDVARHFFTKAEVKKVIDGMALHKLNRLQLHLTDDQGWRIEIKSTSTDDGGRLAQWNRVQTRSEREHRLWDRRPLWRVLHRSGRA